MPHNGQPTHVRVGIHTGSVVTGLIGTKLPKFSIFGDTMNTASRMESTCRPGCIQVSLAARELLGEYTFTPTGGIEVKGKGLMETFLWDPEEHPEEQYVSAREQAREAAGLIAHVSKTLSMLGEGALMASFSSAAAWHHVSSITSPFGELYMCHACAWAENSPSKGKGLISRGSSLTI